MMKRRIFPWMGLIVLFLSLGFSQKVLANDRYKVKRGDTLARISQKTGVSIQALKATNNLPSSSLKPNQTLIIPREGKKTFAKSRKAPDSLPAYYVVKKGDNIYGIAKRCHVSAKTLAKMNHLRAHSLKVGQKLVLARAPARIVMAKAVEGPLEDVGLMEEEGEGEEALLEAEANSLTDAELEEQSNSALVGKWNSPGERKLFVRVVMGFLGAPYRFGGSSVRGLDCSAFVKKIYEFFDVDLPRTAREQSRVGKCVTRDNLEEGDLIFFNTRRTLGHVGIYIGNNEFVHASSRNKTVKIDSLDSEYYDKRFAKAVRLKGLDNGV